MKNSILKSVVLVSLLSLFSSSCSKSSDDTVTGSNPPTVTSLGSFTGNFQVSNDPLTQLGYVYGAVATVSTVGTDATMKVTGPNGLDRTYTGTVTEVSGTIVIISINKQTLPVDKIAAGQLVIQGNTLTMDVNLANDAVDAKETPTSTTTITISGKIRMIGSDFIKQ
jgi:hypothetical protein